MTVRFARAEDAPALLSVYAQYIDTPVTLETELPSAAEFRARVEEISSFYPYLVLEEEGKIVGYAYAHRQMERAAYGWNAELSVYLDGAHLSRGIGKKLYSALMEICALQGIKTVYAGVTLPNAQSEGLHESLGFHRLGVYRNTGFKNGAWHDVAWFEKQISPYDVPPAPVRPVTEIGGSAEKVLQKYFGDARPDIQK